MTITQKEKTKKQFDTKKIEINFTCNHNLCTHDHNKAKTWIFFLETYFFLTYDRNSRNYNHNPKNKLQFS
jgi:hypothetical protein